MWAGAIVIGFLPFAGLLLLGYAAAGLLAEFIPSGGLDGLLPILLVTLYLQFAARHVRQRVERLRDHAQAMSPENATVGLRALYGWRGVLVVLALLSGGSFPLFALVTNLQYSFLQRVLIGLPFVYFLLFQATFIWTWGYSLFSIYRMGKLPLKLAPFTEDRTLGLRPFAIAALWLTILYVVYVVVLFAPFTLEGPFVFTALFVGMLMLGLVFFLLPLRSLRTKLLAAKRDEWRWVNHRYTRLMQRFKGGGDGPLDNGLMQELAAIDKVQRDIHQIRTWPFDTGILVRLTAIIVTVVAIVSARVIQVLLRL